MTFIFLHIVLFLSLGALVYTYVLFPLIMQYLSKGKTSNTEYFSKDELPRVSVLMSLYNEEKVIVEKLQTLAQQDYPEGKLQIYIGSDCSNDATNELVSSFIAEHKLEHFHFYPNTHRQGKPGVIHQLAQEAKNSIDGVRHICIITDASVMLEPDVVFELIKHFKNKQIGLVDSMQVHTGIQLDGISKVEDQYISGETKIKHYESVVNQKMMGPFGGCYAFDASLYVKVPNAYLVDDFFIAMHVLDKGYNAINEPMAICKESVSQAISEEYRRKKRISAGNFQNLVHYKRLLLPSRKAVAFNFWSHKLLRWLGPFFIIFGYFSNAILVCWANIFDVILFAFQTVLIFVLPFMDWAFEKWNINISKLRAVRYFFMMNLALFEGFIRYLKGIKSNVWQPTKRPD